MKVSFSNFFYTCLGICNNGLHLYESLGMFTYGSFFTESETVDGLLDNLGDQGSNSTSAGDQELTCKGQGTVDMDYKTQYTKQDACDIHADSDR